MQCVLFKCHIQRDTRTLRLPRHPNPIQSKMLSCESLPYSTFCCAVFRVDEQQGTGSRKPRSAQPIEWNDRDACHLVPTTESCTHHLILRPHPATMSELLAEIRKIPPVTRFICASIIIVTLPVMTKAISPYTMIFVKEFVTRKREVRLSTHHFCTPWLNSHSHL